MNTANGTVSTLEPMLGNRNNHGYTHYKNDDSVKEAPAFTNVNGGGGEYKKNVFDVLPCVKMFCKVL